MKCTGRQKQNMIGLYHPKLGLNGRSLDNRQQIPLNTFTGNIRSMPSLAAGDFVQFIQKNNTILFNSFNWFKILSLMESSIIKTKFRKFIFLYHPMISTGSSKSKIMELEFCQSIRKRFSSHLKGCTISRSIQVQGSGYRLAKRLWTAIWVRFEWNRTGRTEQLFISP